MQISLSEAGKRFNREWIFRRLSFQFISGNSYAITGPNGSGKSTLLQVIAGAITASEGTISYQVNGKVIDSEHVYKHLGIAAPYEELIEEMTLREFLQFHSRFKPFLPGMSVQNVIDEVGLMSAASKQIRNFSSGMKQRVKLAQVFFSDSACLLLDEPCTNLDINGIELYHRLVRTYGGGRLIIVSSNDEQEYGFCGERLKLKESEK